jgi:hypothetical protein
MNTISEAVSRVRNAIKAVDADSFITDRLIYSNIIKYAKLYIKKQDGQSIQAKFNSLYKRIPCLELIEVDKVEACCDIKSGVIIKRSKDKLPSIIEGTNGPLIRSVGSIDSSIEVYRTSPQLYTSLQKTSGFKYNKKKYFWILNGYLYLPNVEWETAAVDAIFEGILNGFTCDDPCAPAQDQLLNIPGDLFAQVEQMVVNDFMRSAQINPDPAPADKQSLLRS